MGMTHPLYPITLETLISVLKLKDWEHERREILHKLKGNLFHDRCSMKRCADLKRQERVFRLGDMVYLKLQPYRQQTVVHRKNLKLSKIYFGLYKIILKVGIVTYELDLPKGSKIHHVFHVSQLKAVIKRT